LADLRDLGRGQQGDGAASGSGGDAGQRLGPLALRELRPVTRRELLEALWIVPVPAAQLGRRGNLFAPLVESRPLLRDATGPEPVDQDPAAIVGTGLVVDPHDPDPAVGIGHAITLHPPPR